MKDVGVYRSEGPIVRDAIDAVEQKLGYLFPSTYKALMAEHDYLRPKLNLFRYTYRGCQDDRDVNFFGYLSEDGVFSPSRMGDYRFDVAFLTKHIVPFGYSANGDYICFDYRYDPKTAEPQIVLMLHDDYVTDQDGNKKMVVNFVAPTFEAFVDLLYEDSGE